MTVLSKRKALANLKDRILDGSLLMVLAALIVAVATMAGGH